MSADEVLTLEVTDLSRGGAGVAREPGGRVIFVPFTAPGDRVRVRIVEEKKHFAQGELLEILEPSAHRVQPRCPAFGRCGGCQWQHLPYELQWQTKSRGVAHALSRVGLAPPGAVEELPADQIWEYRNRVQLRGEGRILGFYAAKSHDVVPLDRCEIARPEINQGWERTREEGARLPRAFKVELEVLPDGRLRQFWNSRHAAGGFRQVHDAQNEKLKSWVGAALTPGRPLFDLFGGAGNLSLGLASRMREVHCVDVTVPRAGTPGFERLPAGFLFHSSPVAVWLRKRRRNEGDGPWSAIVDPPRIGLGENFGIIGPALERLGVNELVAVGCDPDSWARDLTRFVRRGWRLKRVAALDLFPQTPHVESLALLAFDTHVGSP